MRRGLMGWLLVSVQAALIVALVLTPQGASWATPTWVVGTGWALSSLGAAWAIWAAFRLGDRLTPTPVPRDGGELRTDGAYARMRHPIYSGVLLIVVGIAIRTGSALGLVLAVVTIGFFQAKVAFEERLLIERFPDYPAYAAVTPRFLPRVRRTGRRVDAHGSGEALPTRSRRRPRALLVVGAAALGATLVAAALLIDGDDPVPGVVRDPAISVDGLSFVEFDEQDVRADATLHGPANGLTIAYFGFLSCPDVCPLTMVDIGRARAALEPDDDDRVEVAFITVDPGRDDGERIRDYLGHFFDDGHRALRAADDTDLRAAAERLGVTYELEAHTPGDDDYGVTHSAITYLIDDEGLVVRELPFGVTSEEIAAAIEASLPVS